MAYIEQPQKDDGSCVGCVFSKEMMKRVPVGKGNTKEFKEVPSGIFGCYSPKGEPYSTCKLRGVIFVEQT